jgi:hypothetical protein
LEESTREGYEAWLREQDDVDAAMRRVYQKYYWDAFWEYENELDRRDISYKERMLVLRRWKEEHPTPDAEWFIDMVKQDYGDQFTDTELVEAANRITGVYSIEEGLKARREVEVGPDVTKMENEIWNILRWVPPGKKFFELKDRLDELLDEAGSKKSAEGLLSLWYGTDGKSENWSDQEEFKLFHDLLLKAATEIEIDEPTDEELLEQIAAKKLDDEYRKTAMEMFGDDILNLNSQYGGMNATDRRAFREERPEDYERLKALWEFRDMWAEIYPEWAKVYHPEALEEEKKGKAPPTTGRARAKARARARRERAAARREREAARREALFQPLGRRATLAPSRLLRPGILGMGGVSGRPRWPRALSGIRAKKRKEVEEFQATAGNALLDEILKMYEEGGELSASAIRFLRSLRERHPEWADIIDAILEKAVPKVTRKRRRGIKEEKLSI